MAYMNSNIASASSKDLTTILYRPFTKKTVNTYLPRICWSFEPRLGTNSHRRGGM